jgi:hypothetical protein
MKILIPILLLLTSLIIACGTSRNEDKEKSKTLDTQKVGGKKVEIVEERIDTILNLSDTTLLFPNYKVIVESMDTVAIPDLYKDTKTREAIFNRHDNYYEAGKDLEKYLAKTESKHFKRDKRNLILPLDNGKTKILKDINWGSDSDISYTYQHFFSNINSYLVRIQYYEGEAYLLVNKTNGEEVYTIGETYISPSTQKVMAICEDLEAGYTINGLEMIDMKDGKFKKKFIIQGGNWAPTSLKWLDDNSIVLKAKVIINENTFETATKFYQIKFE